jgi:hypothetical protein
MISNTTDQLLIFTDHRSVRIKTWRTDGVVGAQIIEKKNIKKCLRATNFDPIPSPQYEMVKRNSSGMYWMCPGGFTTFLFVGETVKLQP